MGDILRDTRYAMKRKNLLIVLAVLLFLPALGFALPHLAVLDAVMDAGIDPSAGPLVTSKIEEAFVNSGKYTVLDRANIDRVLMEKEFQLSSGIVRNEEVRQAGEYLGADAVVVASVSRIGQTYVVSAKMIDVVSGQIAAQTSAEKSGRIDVLLEVARMVGGRLAGTDIFIVSVDEQRAQEIVQEKPEEARPREVVEEPEEIEEEEEEEAYAPLPPRQRPWEKNFIFGVRGGFSGSTLATWDDYYIFDPYYGWTSPMEPSAVGGVNAGVYMVVNFGRYLGFQMELDFVQKGYAVEYEAWDGFDYWDAANRWVFNYLEIPLLLKFKIPAVVSPYALLGAYVSLFLSGSVENVYDDAWIQEEYDLFSPYDNPVSFDDLGLEVNSLDFGWVAGVGIDLFLGSLVLNGELKYSAGLTEAVSDDVLAVYFTHGSLVVTFGVGWAF